MRWRVAGSTLALGALTSCALPLQMEPAGSNTAASCPAEQATEAGAVGADPDGLRWYRAATDRDRELAAQWCATVGEPVVRLEPEGGAAEWDVDADLQVISWNMWIGGGDLIRMLEAEFGLACAPGEAPRPSEVQPFVVLLQEVWRHSEELPEVAPSRIVPFTIDPVRPEQEGLDIVEVAGRCGLSLVYVPSARNGPDSGSRPREDKGNAILSNLALSSPLAIDLPLEGGRKVAVAATLQAVDSRKVRVVTAHLDVASTLVRTVFSGYQTRVRQAMGLVEGLTMAEADGLAVDATIVGADMNTWAGNESTLTRMRSAFPQSPEWDGLATRGPFPTDHIFFRTRDQAAFAIETYERIEDSYSSDHYARRLVLSYTGVE